MRDRMPPLFRGRLRVPVIGAPMFLVSMPPLVEAMCKAGIVGTFPHMNARTSEILDQWLTDIKAALEAHSRANPDAPAAPFGVNLVVHPSNTRFVSDLDLVVRHRVPFVLTALGNPAPVVGPVHSYGGLVFADVGSAALARKAIDAGVDGLICISGGAGGHAPLQSAFSLVREIRAFWDGCLVLGGSINDGWQVRAVESLGADMAYVGTRFIAAAESTASEEYKTMLVESEAKDLVYTDRLSGVGCHFLRPSLEKWGVDVDTLPPKRPDFGNLAQTQGRLWRDIWTAGHGVGGIKSVETVEALVESMAREYAEACAVPSSAALRSR